ncbi:haloacid dehalogenase [Kordiimonas sediminis]|uniref:3-deoxy-D-manno-octulosonate 8-phosphate phosphatase KdsC n=1 Tax=Kordiimonas sediminis TaxID=1735581 RepID=A0A919AQE6_9PROT|nr:HAD-IIIA family hydrolase [Kordiimonas sediminis]GHF18327.1 haloacid dehalogenase [Kordiimonas sediminis]
MKIKMLALDVDGVMTDGSIYYTREGEEIKAFHAQDGMGIKYLRKSGVHVVVISGRNSPPLLRRLKDLGIRHYRLKCGNKVEALCDICDDLGIDLSETAFMGDDLIDLAVMQAAGYAISPENGCNEVKAIANFITPRCGGHGAVRDACEHVADMNDIRLVDLVDGKHRV